MPLVWLFLQEMPRHPRCFKRLARQMQRSKMQAANARVGMEASPIAARKVLNCMRDATGVVLCKPVVWQDLPQSKLLAWVFLQESPEQMAAFCEERCEGYLIFTLNLGSSILALNIFFTAEFCSNLDLSLWNSPACKILIILKTLISCSGVSD